MPTLAWRARDAAPPPGGLVAAGAVARAVVRALACRAQQERAGLAVVATRALLVVLGPGDRLPWVEGVRYCAPAPDAPGLWLPTRMEPGLPADLVLAALRRRTNGAALLLWTAPDLLVPLDDPLPLDAGVLAWLDKELD
jgi:hypothetical protein